MGSALRRSLFLTANTLASQRRCRWSDQLSLHFPQPFRPESTPTGSVSGDRVGAEGPAGLTVRLAGMIRCKANALDGGSHMISEITGLGFRETNTWLAALTGAAFPETFYAGTTVGSFNWLMRTLTGMLFAVGCVWFGFPYLERGFSGSGRKAPNQVSHSDTRSTSLQRTRTEGHKTT